MLTDQPEQQPLPEINIVADSTVNEQRYKALLFAGIVLSLALYPYLGQFFLLFDTVDIHRLIYTIILKWILVWLMFTYAQKAEIGSFLLWPGVRYDALFYITSVIVLYLLGFSAGMVSRIPYYLGLHENSAVLIKAMLLVKRYPAVMVITCITAGVTEEFLFRGYILSRLSYLSKSKHWPVIISALIFASAHLAYKTVHEVLFVFLYGLIFGYHYQRYRNLTVLMIAHCLTDLVAFGLYNFHK